MSFDDWLDEIEGFSDREERLWTDFNCTYFATSHNRKKLLDWLRGAYEAGHESGLPKYAIKVPFMEDMLYVMKSDPFGVMTFTDKEEAQFHANIFKDKHGRIVGQVVLYEGVNNGSTKEDAGKHCPPE